MQKPIINNRPAPPNDGKEYQWTGIRWVEYEENQKFIDEVEANAVFKWREHE